MQTIKGFGVEIVSNEVLYQCPNCSPEDPYNLGSYQKLVHIGDKDNDGLADILGLQWGCPGAGCTAQVQVPYEENPQFSWGVHLKDIFKAKEQMFKNIAIAFTGLGVSVSGSPDYLDDTFTLVADTTYDKKFKICFAVDDLSQYDVYVSTQLQDSASDWGPLPAGWTELDCIMTGLLPANATSILSTDVKHILDAGKVTGLI